MSTTCSLLAAPRRSLARSLTLIAAALSLAACTGSSTTDGGADAADARADATTDGATDVTTDAPADAPSDAWDGAVPEGCNPLTVTGECMLPYPSDFLTRADTTTPTHLRMNLPATALNVPAGHRAIDMAPFNRGDGAPTSAPILVHFGVEIDPQVLLDQDHTPDSLASDSPIAVFNAATGERVPFLSEMDQFRPTAHARHVLLIRPLTPLEFGTRYIVAITRRVHAADGTDLPASPGFAALRDGTPSPLPQIEASRAHYEDLFTFLTAHGYARTDLALAWDYTTASRDRVLGPILAMRQQVFTAGATPGGIPYTVDSVTASPNVPGARIIEGTFTPPNYLRDDNTIEFGDDGLPVLQTTTHAYPYTMIVPPIASTQTLPLVQFGHGIFGVGRDYLTTEYGDTIQPLAQQVGGVVVATDWIGLSGGDQQLIISQVAPDLNRIGIVTDRLLQSLVNNLALTELSLGALQADPMVRTDPTRPLLDPTRVYYYGVSLGGIQGSSFVSVSNRISRAVLAVPGGSWSNLLARSFVYTTIKAVLDPMYPDPLLQQEFVDLLQSRFDPTDPANLGTLLLRHPLPDAPAGRVAILQEAIGDCQVPNLTTEILARTLGVHQLTPALHPIWGVDAVAGPTTSSVVAQFALTQDLMNYTPPNTDVLPTMDNGVHSGMVFRPEAMAQVTDLLSTGQVVQHCDGACTLP